MNQESPTKAVGFSFRDSYHSVNRDNCVFQNLGLWPEKPGTAEGEEWGG